MGRSPVGGSQGGWRGGGREAARRFGPALAVLMFQLVIFPVPTGVFLRGIIVGLLSALAALGLALIYRANRIINFAATDLGTVPTALGVYLIAFWGLSYWLALGVGLVAAVLVGGLVELAIIRRFFDAPRLILTVATIGLATLLGAAGLLLPRLWGERPSSQALDLPWDLHLHVDPLIFGADEIAALVVAPLVMIALAVFLRRTDVGIAVRASAERADRAALLGIPVKRLETVVWIVATLLAFMGAWLRAGVVGLPIGGSIASFGFLLRILAALVLGGMVDLPAVALSAVALGVLETGIDWNASSPLLIDPIVGGVIVGALLLRRRGPTRTSLESVSTWRAAEEVRPVPSVLARLPEVRAVRWGGAAVVVAALVLLPNLLSPSDSLLASSIGIYGIVGLSLLVLTGWAGQVSLGQMAFVGLGAAVGAVATSEWGLDLSLALLVAGFAGAVAALIVGLPALRLQGLLLSVTTFAFALAMYSYFLNRQFFGWIPTGRIERPPLFGRIDYDSPTGIYYVILVVLVLCILAVHGMRSSRFGRVLIALRENEAAAQSFALRPVRLRMAAFSLSGFIAALAGGLFVHHQQAFGPDTYGPWGGFLVFTMVVIGGLGSTLGVLVGALYLEATYRFLPSEWRFLSSSLGVLLVLMILPGGIGGLIYRARDGALRWVARRRGLVVPSLVEAAVDDSLPIPTATPAEADVEVEVGA
jgi:ABC-type branched-subunit amino acid transport system permease subunit